MVKPEVFVLRREVAHRVEQFTRITTQARVAMHIWGNVQSNLHTNAYPFARSTLSFPSHFVPRKKFSRAPNRVLLIHFALFRKWRLCAWRLRNLRRDRV